MTKVFILIVVDSIICIVSGLFAYLFMTPYVEITAGFLGVFITLNTIIYLGFGLLFKIFSRINRYTNLREMLAIFFATSLTAAVNVIISSFLWDTFSRRYILLCYIMMTLLIIGSRLCWRLIVEQLNRKKAESPHSKRTLIIGAGEGGRILLNSIFDSATNKDIHVVGFIDDSPNKYHTYLNNVKVLGKMKDIPQIIEDYQIEMIIIAIPSLPKKQLSKLIDRLHPLKVKVSTLPSMEEMAAGKIAISQLREIDVVDLLGREEVRLNMDQIKDQLTNKKILITGAGGSIGSEISRQVMRFNPRKLILLGHGENSIYLIERELKKTYAQKNTEIIPVIADIQDRSKMFEVMRQYHPDLIYHAAAHKHVPLMESNPAEAVKNNIYGTKNVAEAAKANGVDDFVMISTDKAVNPPNVMGATKRIAEKVVMGLNEPGKTKFSAVRFGNVLGSRGSVIPVFKEQIMSGGPVTVTDFRMTRFFMTIPEASRLVIQSGALAKGGEIFILDMGEPVRIVDLARNMIKLSGYTEEEIPIVESGIRPGEKLYEELLVDQEKNQQQVYDKIFVGSVNGVNYEEVLRFVNFLPKDSKDLSETLIRYANEPVAVRKMSEVS